VNRHSPDGILTGGPKETSKVIRFIDFEEAALDFLLDTLCEKSIKEGK